MSDDIFCNQPKTSHTEKSLSEIFCNPPKSGLLSDDIFCNQLKKVHLVPEKEDNSSQSNYRIPECQPSPFFTSTKDQPSKEEVPSAPWLQTITLSFDASKVSKDADKSTMESVEDSASCGDDIFDGIDDLEPSESVPATNEEKQEATPTIPTTEVELNNNGRKSPLDCAREYIEEQIRPLVGSHASTCCAKMEIKESSTVSSQRGERLMKVAVQNSEHSKCKGGISESSFLADQDNQVRKSLSFGAKKDEDSVDDVMNELYKWVSMSLSDPQGSIKEGKLRSRTERKSHSALNSSDCCQSAPPDRSSPQHPQTIQNAGICEPSTLKQESCPARELPPSTSRMNEPEKVFTHRKPEVVLNERSKMIISREVKLKALKAAAKSQEVNTSGPPKKVPVNTTRMFVSRSRRMERIRQSRSLPRKFLSSETESPERRNEIDISLQSPATSDPHASGPMNRGKDAYSQSLWIAPANSNRNRIESDGSEVSANEINLQGKKLSLNQSGIQPTQNESMCVERSVNDDGIRQEDDDATVEAILHGSSFREQDCPKDQINPLDEVKQTNSQLPRRIRDRTHRNRAFDAINNRRRRMKNTLSLI